VHWFRFLRDLVEGAFKVDPINTSLVGGSLQFLDRDAVALLLLKSDGQCQSFLRSFGINRRLGPQRIELHTYRILLPNTPTVADCAIYRQFNAGVMS